MQAASLGLYDCWQVRMLMGRLSRGRGGRPAGARGGDGLDEDVWQNLAEAITAVHGRDLGAASRAMERMGHDAVSVGWVYFYVRYLVQFRVMDLAGGWPSAAQVDKVAALVRPMLASARAADAIQPEDSLRAVFNLVSPEEQVGRGEFCHYGVAILGFLAEDPETELRVLRPRLARVKKLHDARDARDAKDGP